MDGLRGLGGDGFGKSSPEDDSWDDETPGEPLPPVLGQDERRMQVRAYNFWTSLLQNGPFPPVASLLDGTLPDFADRAVLLHFDEGYEDPAIDLLGSELAAECGESAAPRRLSEVPGRSLLSRITDHYMQIIANEAPIGFEAEFVNQRGRSILYRGILLPFSSDGRTIDYIYGVINWKELADQQTTDELMLAIGQVLEMPARRTTKPTASWADGPAPLDLAEIGAQILSFPDSDPEAELEALPAPDFGGDDEYPLEQESFDHYALADWLASARDMVHAAHASEDRTRGALYAAIGRAWDFALAAREATDDYAAMIADAGLTMQARAPLIPLVKLVFGADYDKTRLTEYATVLGHAERLGLERGSLAAFLTSAPGGLKGVVAAERRLRREEAGKDRPRTAAEVVAETLRALPPRPLTDVSGAGSEFALLVIRRLPDGEVALLGEVNEDPLIERAARRLVG